MKLRKDKWEKRRFKSEVHHPGACARGAHGDNLMFSITKRNPHELLST